MLFIPQIPSSEYVEREDRAREIVAKLDKYPYFAFDTETDGLDILKNKPLFFSIATPDFRCSFPAKFAELFKELFAGRDKVKIAANAKFDMHMLKNIGVDTHNIADVIVMAHMENTERAGYSIKDLAATVFGYWDSRYIRYKSPFVGKIKNIRHMISSFGLPAAMDYASLDAWVTFVLFEELKSRLSKIPAFGKTLWDLFVEEESLYTEVLFGMERTGILLDLNFLQGAYIKAKEEMQKLEGEFAEKAGVVLNLNSTDQLRKFFYKRCGKKLIKTTKKKNDGAVDEETLQRWEKEGDIFAAIIRKYRKIQKLSSTYLKGLLDKADADCRIHTVLNQAGTQTGRLSSSRPNLQNIPRPDNDPFSIRQAFVASPGKVIIDFDYSQIEQVLIAALAGDKLTIKAFVEGKDLHSITAAQMYGIPYEDIVAAKKKEGDLTDQEKRYLKMRYEAKTIGFGLNYGEGPTRLADSLGCSVEEAKEKVAQYFSIRPMVKRFIDKNIDSVKEKGYIVTLSGRRRHMSLATIPNKKISGMIAKDSTNSIIQGSAADIIRKAMLLCADSKVLKQCGAKMLLQVHDELLFECPLETADLAMAEIKTLMEIPYLDRLRDVIVRKARAIKDKELEQLADRFWLIADGEKGTNWLEAKR